MFIFNQYGLRALSESALLHYRKHALVMAILLFICGVCCLIYPFFAAMYLSYLTGMLFMMCGFYTLYSLLVFRKQNWKSIFAAVLFAVAWLLLGFLFIVNPIAGMNSLAILFCCLFIVGGVSRILSGFSTIGMPGYGWNIFIGILDLLIAGLWIGMNPEQSYLFTTAFIGVEMIFSAISFLSLRKVLKPSRPLKQAI